MHRQIICWLTVICVTVSASLLRAAENLPVEGTMLILGRTYQLSHAIAYETKSGDFELVTVVASNRRIFTEKLQESLRSNQSDDGFSLSQPYVKVVFQRSGEVQNCNAWADNGSFSTGGEALTGNLKIEGGHARGKAALALQGEGDRQRKFDFHFDVVLGADSATQPKPKPAVAVKATVSGKFTGNGKAAKLVFVSARPREPFDDKPALLLIFTEKDHALEPRPDIRAAFGHFGSALMISVAEDGSIFGCEVAHSGHAKKPFSSLGSIRMAEFDVGDGYVQGHITTDGEKDALDQKWEVDLKFSAPLATRKTTAAVIKPAAPPRPEAKKPSSAPDSKPEAAALNVRELPLPKDATDIEYKQIVEQLVFKSRAPMRTVAGEFAKKLADQGWTQDGTDLITPQSAILKRDRGEATLTVMVKPAAGGSQVLIFSEGLIWEEK